MSHLQTANALPLSDTSIKTLHQLATIKPDLLVTAIEACPVNITIADAHQPDMPLIYVNPAFTNTTGYAADEVVGRNCRFLQGPETDKDAVAVLRQAILEEKRVSVEFINYRKDGTPFINALTMAPVHDENGQLVSFLGIQNDITEKLRQEQSEIEQQRLQALGQMAGGVAHQLNNLLQPIISLTSLHQSDMSPSQMVTDFGIVLQSARQASDVVGDILAFSRQNAGNLDTLNVADMVRANVEFIRSMLPVSMELVVSVAPEAEAAKAQLEKIKCCQVLANLIINANHATEGKGRVNVDVSIDDAGDVEISVKDNGPGIPASIRSKVFEPFFSTRLDNDGTGLGLSVVYGIVKSFGGRISISDATNNGADSGCNIVLSFPRL